MTSKKLIPVLLSVLLVVSCKNTATSPIVPEAEIPDLAEVEAPDPQPDPVRVVIEKALAYDRYTLEDLYPYKDTTRNFQWDKIRRLLEYLESLESGHSAWAVFQNKANINGEAPAVRNWHRDAYKLVADSAGVSRYQSVPLYLPGDTVTPERYGRDGSLVKYKGEAGSYYLVENSNFAGEWLTPKRYLKLIPDSITVFDKAVFVDRHNQNIATLERSGGKWLVRSMNPATTGLHNPPYGHETPLGIFVVQEKKQRMVYLKDGSTETGGFAPWASRFSSGGYIHGVPVNVPGTQIIEFSPSLGTTPRSHMCVRNASSHAKFIYDWAPVFQSLVFVFE